MQMKLILKAKCCTLLIVFAIVYSCSQGKIPPNYMKEFRDNHYDFKKFEIKKYADISFNCPKVFEKFKGTDFTYKNGGLVLVNMQMGLYLTVEKFNRMEAEQFMVGYDGSIFTELLAVHAEYVDKRIASLTYCENSIRSELPNGSLAGSMEVIVGKQENIFEDLTYKIATIEKGNNFYVFQFIAGDELIAYLNDDFDKIIKSIQ